MLQTDYSNPVRRDIENLINSISELNNVEKNNDEISAELTYRNQLVSGISNSKSVNNDNINTWITKSNLNLKLKTLNF